MRPATFTDKALAKHRRQKQADHIQAQITLYVGLPIIILTGLAMAGLAIS